MMFAANHNRFIAGAMALLLCFGACKKIEPEIPIVYPTPIDPAYYAGGTTTVFNQSSSAYIQWLANASATSIAAHQLGSELFFATFSEFGSASPDGLGPLFIQNSCVGCHPMNGRSHPPLTEIDYDSGLLMRMSLSGAGPNGEPIGVPGYGTQLQNRAINGVVPEGHFLFNYQNYIVTYDDGTQVTLHNPSHQLIDAYTELPANVLYSLRLASPIFGLGLLEAINAQDIMAGEDESDDNTDYISGKANFVWNVKTQQLELGRFGWKASNPTIAQQTAGAFNEDMGITSVGFFPQENGVGQSNCVSGFGMDPDIHEYMVANVANYVATLAVPAPRNLSRPDVARGRQLFNDLNCVGCHRPSWTTGISTIPELSNQTIYPYTDMLLHDMGEILADGRPDFDASTNEWRTPPLWGIGLAKLVNPNARFLHDGRAETLEEAILWHGGEAHWIIEYFKSLPAEDRAAVIAFLEAL